MLVNCVNRGVVKTGIMSEERWCQVPAECMKSTEQIVDMVNSLLRDKSYGNAVELLGNHTSVNDGPLIKDDR